MILQKISTFFVAVSVITLSIIGLGYYTAAPASALEADSIPSQPSQCPIDGFVSVAFNNSDKYQIETDLVSTLVLSNTSSYVMGGVRVGLAVYSNTAQIIPDYWFVSDEQYQLLAGEMRNVDVTIDASIMPAGEYVVRSFAMQGDEAAVLGAIMRGESEAANTIIKRSQKTSDVAVVAVVNGERSNGQTVLLEQGENIGVAVQTTNTNDVPLLDSSMVITISQGDVPLGAALRESVRDSVKLVPNGMRDSQVFDQFTESGDYSVFAALVTKNTFQPVEYVSVKVGSDSAAESWAYLSQVGVSDLVLNTDTEVVGCINYLGAASELQGVIETLAMEVTVTDGENVLFTNEVQTQDMQQSFLSVNPGLSAEKVVVSATLLQQRFPSTIGREDEEIQNVSGETEIFFTPVQTLVFDIACESDEGCSSGDGAITMTDEGSSDTQARNSFYFYAAIVIAAALLLYIMLRRLHPEEPVATEANSNELQ